jgi:hypothetical protein
MGGAIAGSGGTTGGASGIGGTPGVGGNAAGAAGAAGMSGTTGCPPSAPTDGGDCSAYGFGLFCEYPGASGATQCACTNDLWTCRTQDTDCPPTRPMTSDDCSTIPNGTFCAYSVGTCTCTKGGGMGQHWDCFGSTGCPLVEPIGGTGCPGLRTTFCTYVGGSCFCNMSETWSCF